MCAMLVWWSLNTSHIVAMVITTADHMFEMKQKNNKWLQLSNKWSGVKSTIFPSDNGGMYIYWKYCP